MSTRLQSEDSFLRRFAVDRFNRQYGKNFDPDRCEIRSIVPGYNKTYGYEITTARTDDFVRMKIFFSLGNLDQLSPYRLEVDGKVATGSLEDEVYVAVGVVNRWYFDSGTYRFRWMGRRPHEELQVVDLSGQPMRWMDGSLMEFSFLGS